MEAKEILGLDVGKKYIGIARASDVAALAEPLTTMKSEESPKQLAELIAENGVDTIVVGLPRNLQGDETAQTNWVRKWVDDVKKNIDVNFYWQDEALTSKLAELHQLKSKYKNPIDEHAMAAAIILQDFLDAPEAQRTPC